MANRRHRLEEKTIRQKLILPLLIIVMLQSAAVILTLTLSGAFSYLDQHASRIIWLSLLISFVIGFILTSKIGGSITRPIIKLSRQVKELDPDQSVSLDKTRISELDDLITSLEKMSVDVASAAARLSSAIDLVGLRLASFEEWPEHMTVHVSDSIFELLDLEPSGKSRSRIGLTRWNGLMLELLQRPDTAYNDVYIWQPDQNPKKRWIRLRLAGPSDRMTGILMDVTEDVLRHRRLELERDYDALTHLLNKPAFLEQCNQSLSSLGASDAAVMIFSDLDNLKQINDQYGHKFGDRYIQMAAGAFGQFRRHQGLAARLSGDEFAVFLTGNEAHSGKQGLRQLIKQVFSETNQQKMAVPDEKQISLKMSVGLAWYPTDAQKIDDLLNLADFAMYQIKKDGKSGLHEFNETEYLQNQTLMEGRANLDQLLELRQLECVAQPVVDAKTADIIGYAMTMRPLHSRIRLPLEVIELARQQNRLNDLECLMFELCSLWTRNHLGMNSTQKIFFGALSCYLCQIETDDLPEEQVAPLRNKLVVDINGSNNFSEMGLNRLSNFLSALSGQLAVSQLRSDSEQDSLSEIISPDFIRLDHSVIRDIDKDIARQQLLASRVSYCADQGIRVIAEGIETEAEMVTAIRLGADYLQGYYLGRPQSETAELTAAMRLQILSAARLS